MIKPQPSCPYPAIFLVSISIIAYQLLLIQVLSLVQWYHFAYMIISVALLGFGASGSILTILRKPILKNSGNFAPLFLWLCGLLMIVTLRLTQSQYLAFDSYLVFRYASHLIRLIITYILYFLPFLCGALFLGLSFRTYPHKIGKLYFFNLTGSAVGGLLIILLLHYLTAQQAIALVAIFPVIAAFLTLDKKSVFRLIVILATILVAVLSIIKPPSLYLSEYKSLSKVLNMPDTAVIAERTSPYGLLQAVRSPYLRYAPGLSFQFHDEIPFELVIFNNGEFIGPLFPLQFVREHYYDYSTLALPFLLSEDNRALIIEAGSGDMASYAAYKGFESITAVDGNPALFDFIMDDLASIYALSPYHHPAVRTVPQDSYSFLLTDEETYDLIILPLADAFGGSAGIYAMQEKYSLTLDAFQQMWDKLTEQGNITISSWIDYPLRYPLKTLATLTELLERNGIEKPEEHIAAIRNWSMITFVLSKNPLTEVDLSQVRTFSSELGFDILLLPGLGQEERTRFHTLTDESLFHLSDQILSPGRQDLYRHYQFNIRPATEDSPYFFQFLKIGMITKLLQDFDLRELPFLELGYLLVLLTFIQIAILTTLFVILPLIIKRWKSSGKTWTFFYFCFLGLGFMMLEIVLIQRFIYYLGTPLYSTAAVISAMLLFSGIGSSLSSGVAGKKRNFSVIIILIILLIFLYAIFLNFFLQNTLQLNLFLRIILTLVYVAPLGLLLGFPFPLGIKILDTSARHDNIAWAWGINGSFSVVSTVLATIIAVEAGFFVVMMIAAVCYFLALLTHFLFKLS